MPPQSRRRRVSIRIGPAACRPEPTETYETRQILVIFHAYFSITMVAKKRDDMANSRNGVHGGLNSQNSESYRIEHFTLLDTWTLGTFSAW